MANHPPQFTPAQILEAGQRAEADGRIDHAIQFYRHLVEHYPYEQEAALARDGLGRLDRSSAPAPPKSARDAGYPASSGTSSFNQGHHPDTGGPSYGTARADPRQQANPPALSHGATSGLSPARSPSYGQTPPSGQQARGMQLAPAGYDPDETVFVDETDTQQRGYGFGRFLAGTMTVLGVLFIFAAIALVIGLFTLQAVRDQIASAPGALLLAGALGPATLVVFGIAFCLFGQIARAVFDTADATRHSAATHRVSSRV